MIIGVVEARLDTHVADARLVANAVSENVFIRNKSRRDVASDESAGRTIDKE